MLRAWALLRPAFFGFIALAALLLEVAPARGEALALVLAIDVSASVTADSYLLQHDGIALAFEHPRLVEAISAATGGIEVLVLEWSDKIAVTVGWTRVADTRSAHSFADAVRPHPKSWTQPLAPSGHPCSRAGPGVRSPLPPLRRLL